MAFASIRSASIRKRLWLGAAGVALFIATIFAARQILATREPPSRGVGLDFIAFYTAGAFVKDGRLGELYDLRATQRFQHDLALGHGVNIGQACGPWWNPPFYALVFVPLARLPYPAALGVWLTINLLCAATACCLLCRMFPRGTPWRTWALVPVLLVLSTPFIFAISHAQNTCTSLLILTATVWLWRLERPIWAGLIGGLLFYKPQLAVAVAGMMVLDLGWRAALGYALTGAALLAIALLALPGSLSDYLHRLPANIHLVQTQSVYLWERHVTFKAFWRLLIQGRAIGDTSPAANVLTWTCAAGTCLAAVISWIRARPHLLPLPPREGKPRAALLPPIANRKSQIANPPRDLLIAATITLTPLVMPFYFDYDLLLLAIPAVLLAIDPGLHPSPARANRWLLITWSTLYLWLMLNPDIAERFRVNLAVPLLALLAFQLIARIHESNAPTANRAEADAPLARAA